jgi:hypothetical protein
MKAALRAGSYPALASTLGLKFVPFENFLIEPEVAIVYHAIVGVAGLDDRQGAFDTLAFEMRYRVLSRDRAPFTSGLISWRRPPPP